MKKNYLLLFALIFTSGSISAADLIWDGYFSAAYAQTNSESSYRELVSDQGSFADSRFGVHLATEVDRLWMLEAQFFAAGYEENYNLVLDWAFVAYQVSHQLQLKFGKLKYPNNLVSEYYDVGLAYPWVRPPHEFYGQEELSTMVTSEAFNGMTAIYSRHQNSWEYIAQPFFGEISLEEGAGTVSKLLGLKFTAAHDIAELQLSVAQGRINFEGHEYDEKKKRVVTFGTLSEWGNLVNYLEYAVSEIDDEDEANTKVGYYTLGYHFGDTMPHLTFSKFDQENGWGQKSITLGVKQMLNSNMAVKFEIQRVTPEDNPETGAEMEAGLFEEAPESEKVNVFTIAVDMVF